MKAHTHTLSLFAGSLLSTLLISYGYAQQGDRKGHVMTDPIPADKIPPSPYLSLEETMKEFKIASGFVIEPVASGKDVDQSVALSFDANGRVWSCEMRSYMPTLDAEGENEPIGRIRVLEDTTGDGKIDKTTVFIDDLVLPRAVAVTSDGCLYTSGSTLYFIKRNGLKPVGEPIVVDEGYAKGGNPEHLANGLVYGHDNWYYSAKKDMRYRRIKGQWIKEKTNMRGQWGITKDNAGHLYFNSNSIFLQGDIFPPMFLRGNPKFTPKSNFSKKLGSNATNPIHITPGVNRAYMEKTLDKEGKLQNATAAGGATIYRGDNFPSAMQGMAFVCEPAGDLVKAIKLERDKKNIPSGSHPYGDREFLASTDEWFLPCNLYTAPDGSLWMVDMYFGLLQHKGYMTSYLRKQYISRKLDQPKPSSGRIYRIRYKKNKLSPVPKLEGHAAVHLIGFLTHPNGTIRDTAQRLIVESGDSSISSALANLVSNHSQPLGQIHAMWTLAGLDSITPEFIIPALRSSHTEVVNNALDIIARHRISGELLHTAMASLPNESRTLQARIRAMAASGMTDQALSLTLKNTKLHFAREAFISGLGTEATIFRKKHAKLKDGTLDKLLTTATKALKESNIAKVAPGSHLKGEDLASFHRGKKVYIQKAACMGCHGEDGQGLENLGPPLVKSEWVTGDAARLTKIILHGMFGPLTINGKKFNPALAMPGLKDNQSISDKDLADVMTYVRNGWSNKAQPVNKDFVKKIRATTANQQGPYEAKTLER